MKFRITTSSALQAIFVANMRAVMAGESWVRSNPGDTFKVEPVKLPGDDEYYNCVAIYDDKGNMRGWLTLEDTQ